jgi:hypothetical protein
VNPCEEQRPRLIQVPITAEEIEHHRGWRWRMSDTMGNSPVLYDRVAAPGWRLVAEAWESLWRGESYDEVLAVLRAEWAAYRDTLDTDQLNMLGADFLEDVLIDSIDSIVSRPARRAAEDAARDARANFDLGLGTPHSPASAELRPASQPVPAGAAAPARNPEAWVPPWTETPPYPSEIRSPKSKGTAPGGTRAK